MWVILKFHFLHIRDFSEMEKGKAQHQNDSIYAFIVYNIEVQFSCCTKQGSINVLQNNKVSITDIRMHTKQKCIFSLGGGKITLGKYLSRILRNFTFEFFSLQFLFVVFSCAQNRTSLVWRRSLPPSKLLANIQHQLGDYFSPRQTIAALHLIPHRIYI